MLHSVLLKVELKRKVRAVNAIFPFVITYTTSFSVYVDATFVATQF